MLHFDNAEGGLIASVGQQRHSTRCQSPTLSSQSVRVAGVPHMHLHPAPGGAEAHRAPAGREGTPRQARARKFEKGDQRIKSYVQNGDRMGQP